MNAGSHVVVPFVSQDADDFGSQRFVQNFDGGFAISGVARGNCAVFDVLSRALAQSFDISEKWFIRHDPHSLKINLGEQGY
jgi:hypothetical protein